MLNFRQLKKDISPTTLKEGKQLFDQACVASVSLEKLTTDCMQLTCSVKGAFEKSFTCKMEIDRKESMAIDADCSCPEKFDCQHLAAALFHLEKNIDELIVNFSKGSQKLTKGKKEDTEIKKTILQAEKKVLQQKEEQKEKELIEEYLEASLILGTSSFFHTETEAPIDTAELYLLFQETGEESAPFSEVECSLLVRQPHRSKPLTITNAKEFIEALYYLEPQYIGNRRYLFSMSSFDKASQLVLKHLFTSSKFIEGKDEKLKKFFRLDKNRFGEILSDLYEMTSCRGTFLPASTEEEKNILPCVFRGSPETPLTFSTPPAVFEIELDKVEAIDTKFLLNPKLRLSKEEVVLLDKVLLLDCQKPGLIFEDTYYRFNKEIKRCHLKELEKLRSLTIPKPLFGTFVEISIPQLTRFAKVTGLEKLESFATLPFTGKLTCICELSYLDGELEATATFDYDGTRVPSACSKIEAAHLCPFVTKEGILARNLTEEQKIIENLFQDFTFHPQTGVFATRNERKIIEFMTEVIPKTQDFITYHCPENLLEQFVYDNTTFELSLKESDRIDVFLAELKVDGYLKGLTLDQLYECLTSRRSYIPLSKKKEGETKCLLSHKILVLDLDKLSPVAQIFDEIGLQTIDNNVQERPLWALAGVSEDQFKDLPIKFSMSKKLLELQNQMRGQSLKDPSPIPKEIKASLRSYQVEGVQWLERLASMHLSGILADDMGLGKTLQAITAITLAKKTVKLPTLVVCPTSLLYNWEEEIDKFNPKLTKAVIDGTPQQRVKLLKEMKGRDILITSYSLLQKDIEHYETMRFCYAILDEAQHIKNRSTRNAKSVKRLRASHKLILTGTPIENSLDELWSLFDFLMPGLLSTYERFLDRYIRNPKKEGKEKMEELQNKAAPFILRRMKKDVLKDLPAVSDIVYHCHLKDEQKALYQSYAESARKELSQLVKKEGFDKVQIHVLATLTRLKQICCHPAIFAKEGIEENDSAKYEMLKELLQNLMDGGHKTVIFSQYTKMLKIMHDDFQSRGIPFSYLDGTSKNRLEIVKQFNENDSIPVFLVSLKAGGSGLNLTGADTVIHYDMWWNPAVENQATDRVHRMGQKKCVSSYKLVTKGTIEEKIIEMQNRKRGLVTKVISCDEEVIAKLTWEEVLELLQT